MKLKDMKEKHDHKFTDLLKVGIFALLMIAPLFASVSQMLYATFNKNAYQSYYGKTINDETINITNNLVEGNKYYITNNNITPTQTNSYANADFMTNEIHVEGSTQDFTSATYFRLYLKTNGTFEMVIFSPTSQIGDLYITDQNLRVSFIFLGLRNTTNPYTWQDYNLFYEIQYNKYSFLDNAFYYGVDQMTKSDLFNWTQNTAIYTGVKAMTDNLQIQTPTIAILIVYWFILTIIYIIIDIVIKCFTAITHLI